jgi:hypothetical protein
VERFGQNLARWHPRAGAVYQLGDKHDAEIAGAEATEDQIAQIASMVI